MTHPIRVGRIPYLNCALFFHEMEAHPDIRLAPLVPSALSAAATEGRVDAGPVPLVDTWELESSYAPLGDFCISTTAKARSVLLFSKRHFEELHGGEIGVTGQSSTSVRLLKVMLARVWRVRPARFAGVDPHTNDAYLLIGDQALLERRGTPDHPHVADLGEVWNQWTGLPFVFARWVVRRDVPAAAREELRDFLEQTLARGWSRLERIAAERASEVHMTPAEVREYLEGFRFRATAAEYEAMARFRELDTSVRGVHAAIAEDEVKR